MLQEIDGYRASKFLLERVKTLGLVLNKKVIFLKNSGRFPSYWTRCNNMYIDMGKDRFKLLSLIN